MTPILRNGGSQSPDRWLRDPRNNHGRIIVYKRIWHNKRNEQLNRNRVNRNRIFNKSPNLINKNVHQVICPHVFNAQRAEKNNDRRLNQTASKDNQCQYQNQVQADSDRQLVQTEYQHNEPQHHMAQRSPE